MSRLDFGPVFVWELRRVSRQWWFYAGRSALVGGLLLGLGVVWWATTSRGDRDAASTMARVGEWFFVVIAVSQIAMVLLAAPAATAGSFGTEKSRGHVCQMLTTEVGALAIVFGTLAARLLPVLGGVLCVVPVLSLTAHLGGIPSGAMVDLVAVTVGSAVLGCALALAVSIGARRTHESLVATYVLLVGWVLGYPILLTIQLTAIGRLIPGGWLRGFLEINPIWLALAPVFQPGSSRTGEAWAFLGGTLLLSTALVLLAAWRLRPAVLSDERRATWRYLARFPAVFGSPSMLDAHPVFWRECRLQRPTSWIGLLWGFYVVGAVLFTVLAASECAMNGTRRTPWASAFNGFQNAVGLMLLSLITPAALAEERARGSLEVLLSTPLSTRSLVLGKWLAHYRVVLWLAVLPTVVAVVHAIPSGRWIGVLLVMGTVLAQGAAVTSLGIALATWVPRLDRAVTLSAAASVFITVAWIPLMFVIALNNPQIGLGLASASPFLGIGVFTTAIADAPPTEWPSRAGWVLFWVFFFSIAALVLLRATLATFDRSLGRITPRARSARPGTVDGADPVVCPGIPVNT